MNLDYVAFFANNFFPQIKLHRFQWLWLINLPDIAKLTMKIFLEEMDETIPFNINFNVSKLQANEKFSEEKKLNDIER